MKVSFLDVPRTGTTRAVLVERMRASAVRACMRRENHPDLTHVYSTPEAARRAHPGLEIPTTMPEFPNAARLPRVSVIVSDMDPEVLRERVAAAYFDDDVLEWRAVQDARYDRDRADGVRR